MIKRISFYTDEIVKKLLVLIVFSMLLFSVFNVVMRWFGISYSWIEPMVRHLVFSTAFLGATLATASSKHIGIEILQKYLETKNKENLLFLLSKISNFISFIILYFLANSGYEFFSVEKRYGADSFLGIHSSTLVLIIPIGFYLMMFRSALNFLDFSKKSEA